MPASLGQKPERGRDQKDQKPQWEEIPHQCKKKEINKGGDKALTQQTPGSGNLVFVRTRAGINKNVFGVAGDKLVNPCIDLCKKVLFPTGQYLRNSLEISPTRSAELDFRRIVFSTTWTEHF